MIAYNRVAGFVVTGNEDGAKNCISELASAAVELGFAAGVDVLEHGSRPWSRLRGHGSRQGVVKDNRRDLRP